MNILFFAFAALLFLSLILFFYTCYRLHIKLHFHAENAQKSPPPQLKSLTFFATNSNNQKIAYWYFPVRNAKAVVILIHGYSNPGGKDQMLVHAKYLRENGYSTVLLDLRAYGESDGSKTTLATQEWKDVEAVYDQVKSLPENKNAKVGFLGISMGASTAIMAAGKTQKGDFVIASAPFASIKSLFSPQLKSAGLPPSVFYPFLKVAALLELGKDHEMNTPAAVIEKVKVPILLISASRDKDVAGSDAKYLFDLANQPKDYWKADSEHDVFDAHPEEFRERVEDFLAKNISD